MEDDMHICDDQCPNFQKNILEEERWGQEMDKNKTLGIS